VSAHTTANIYLNNARGLAIGSTAGDGNTIDLADHGIIAGGDLTGTTVAGNSITDNAVTGVLLSSAQNATVDSNQINNNGPYGIFGTGDLAGSSIKSNTLSDQQVGVYVYEGSNLTIGSSDGTLVPATEGNTISNNSFAGVILDGGTDSNGSLTANVSVLSNSIYNNSQFGIALVNGANDGLTRPSLDSANTTLVTGSITGTDGDVFRIQYFKSSANVTTSSRTAQAEELIAYQDVTINGTQASIDLNIASAGVNATDWITVSKTLMDGSTPKATSELSYGVRVVE
jgi:parallel beta-helix repeat protein